MNKIDINKNKEGIFIKLNEKVSMEELINFISKNEVEAPDMKMINIVLENIGKDIKIAEYYGETNPKYKIDITISEDNMKAYIEIEYAKGRKMIEYTDVIDEIKKKGIKKGIKEEAIMKIINKEIVNTKVLIAEGEKAVKGKKAYPVYFKDMKKEKKIIPNIDITGKADFKNINLIEKVSKGDIIAEKIEAEEGIDGYDVYGNVIKSEKGEDIKLLAGKNAKLSSDGMKVIADADGSPVLINDKIEVKDVLILDEVGVKTGNIDFNGSVVIKGDVSSEYMVKANGDIKINGNVDNASIYAQGDINITGNCYGKQYAIIKAKGNISINFAENIKIISGKDIVVNEGVINCDIIAYGKFNATMRSGKVIGGKVRAECGLEILNAGADTEIETELIISGKVEELEEMYEKIKDMEWELKTIEKNITILNYLKKNTPELYNLNKENMFLKLIKEKMNILQDKRTYEVRYDIYIEKIKKENTNKISIKNKCYAGVKIILEDKIYEVKNLMERIEFFIKDNIIQYNVSN